MWVGGERRIVRTYMGARDIELVFLMGRKESRHVMISVCVVYEFVA